MSKYSRRVRIIESVDIPQAQYDAWKASGTEVTPGLIRQTKEGIAAGLPNYQKLQAEKGFWEGPAGSVIRAIGIGALNLIPYVGPVVSAGVREADRQTFQEKTGRPMQPISQPRRVSPTVSNVQASNPELSGNFPSLFLGSGGSSSGPYMVGGGGALEGEAVYSPDPKANMKTLAMVGAGVALFLVVLTLVRR